MTLSLQSTTEISPGVHIPRLGFGVYDSPRSICQKSVQHALKVGYRHIDSAMYYDNEEQVGLAVKASGIPREDIFVSTKIISPPQDVDGHVMELPEALRFAVDKFGLDHVDLFLVHTPTSGLEGRLRLWEALEKLKESGKTRAIGVSNFGVRHLQQLAMAGKSKPAVNQIELHPWHQQRDIVAYCKDNDITIEAFCPLVRGQKFQDPTVQKLAASHRKEPAQVLLRWSLQKGYVPLPKSDTPNRMETNAAVYDFELSVEEMDALDALECEGAIAPNNVNCP